MELNLDYLYKQANALKNVFNDKETDKDFSNTGEEEDKSTQESVLAAGELINTDTKTADEKTSDEETQEIITTKDKEKEKDTEESLEEKLENIEKVIDTFSGKGTTVVDSGQSVGQAQSINLNQQGLDLGTTQAKAYQAEYLKPSTVHDDRIALLYEDLKKYNLI